MSWGAWTPPPPPVPPWQKIPGSAHGVPVQISLAVLGCVDAVLKKKLNFDLKTPSLRVWGGRRGGRRGESQQFFRHVRASHTLLGRLALFPHRPRVPESSRIDVRIRGELYFFIFNSFVMFYDSVTKWVRNSYEYSWDSSGFGLSTEFTTMYNNPINKLKNRSRNSWEYAECSMNWIRIKRNPRRFVMICEIFSHLSRQL